jgi:hypothetical protein
MPDEIRHYVQAFRDAGGKLEAENPVECTTAKAARLIAERLAPARAGIVAFSSLGDRFGPFDEGRTILFQAGRVPVYILRGATQSED